MNPRSRLDRSIVALGLGLVLSGAVAFAAPVAIGFVAPDEEPRHTNLLLGLRQGLQAAGVDAERATIIVHPVRRGDSSSALHAVEAVLASKAQVAFVVGTELAKSVRSVSKELPIVLITPGDPVRAGLAASLARPGNHLTGMTFEFPELSAKRVQLLKEIAPGAQRVGAVYDGRDGSPRQGLAAANEAAVRLGIKLVELDVETLSRGGNLAAQTGRLDGLVLIPGGAIATVTAAAMNLAAAQRIASVVWARNEGTHDAVLSYGVNDVEVARNAARLIVRILNGQRAGDLPIEQPTRFELVVNLTAAKALGVTIPRAVLLRADEVIQ